MLTCIIKNRTKEENENQVNLLQIKGLRYEKQHLGKIRYRYDRDGPYNIINIHGKGRNINISQTSIKNNLLKLCHNGIIPQELHPWYRVSNCRIKEKTAVPALGVL